MKDYGVVTIDYTNWRGERAVRRVRPISIRYVSTRYHPDCQWILRAVDLDKDEQRDFSMKDIHSWKEGA